MSSSQNSTNFQSAFSRLTLKAMAVGLIVGVAAGIIAIDSADGEAVKAAPGAGERGTATDAAHLSSITRLLIW